MTGALAAAQMPQLRLKLRQSGSGISIICVYERVCERSSVSVSRCESLQRFDQVQLVSVFAGENGGFLVVLHQLVHGGELALADTVNSV